MKKRGQTVYKFEDRIERLTMPEPNSGCLLWVGSSRKNPSGMEYGRLVIGSRSDGSRRSVAAHRLSYETYKGAIPDGLYVCHKCDNSLCVNPDHLFTGTQSDNMKDALAKGRITPPTPPKRSLPSPPKTDDAT